MRLVAFITAVMLSGLLMGLVVELPVWLFCLSLLLCAVGTTVLYRILSATPKISLGLGAAAGLLSGAFGAIIGTLNSVFSGRVAVGIVNAADDFDRIARLLQGNLFHNFLWYSVLGLVGCILGAVLSRRLILPSLAIPDGKRKVLYLVNLILVIVACLILPFYPQLNAVFTIQKVDDYPLFVMHYSGNYGFSELMHEDLEDTTFAFKSLGPACTSIAALSPEGHPLFGKNEDWRGQHTLLLFTDPPGGYASSFSGGSYVDEDTHPGT